MIVQHFFYLPVLISLLGITLFIISRGLRNRINRFFGLFTSSLFLWLTGLYFADTSSVTSRALTATRVAVMFACLIPLFFLWFSMIFPADNKKRLKKSLLLAVPSVALMSLSFSNLMVQEVTLKEYVAEPTVVGPVYTLFLIYFVLYFLSAFVILIRKYRKTQKLQRSQIAFVLAGTVFGVSVNLVFNFIFVILGLAGIGLLLGGPSILVFALLVTYAIVKHRLFDIRLVLARSVGYILSVVSLGALYSLLSFLLINRFLAEGSGITRSQAISFTVIAVLLAFAFQPLKRFFDKITSQIFYRDAYEPQKFLDDLNNVLVANIELDKLLTETISVVESNIKADFTVFSIRETSYFERRVIGDTEKHFDDSDIQDINASVTSIHEKVIVTDYLEEGYQGLKRTLEKNDIAILIRLVATLDYEVEGVGYVMFGAKKSGNPYNKQDIQTLEIIANELVIAIQNALRFEEIEKFNATLQDKIDDATKRLQKTNEKLKALDETKDEFISMASHQLRTPLTSVKGYLSMVLEGDAGDVSQMQRKLLDQAFVSSQRMVYLIADLLNVSRLRTGKFVIESVATNLADVIEGESSQLHDTAASRGLTLTYKKPEKFPSLMLDETKIRQVIMNFMDNAIYYTPSGGHITVELKDTDKTVEYTVHDDGIGVPKHEQHHLFTKFYRAGNAKKARPDGTGLGLFMAKKVIVAQGGSLIFTSAEGKGSTFGFTFEKAKLLAKTPTDTPPQT